MKRIVIVTVIMCAISPAYAQNDLIDRITKQAVEIDSLIKVVKAERDNNQEQRKKYQSIQDTLRNLRLDLAKLEEFKTKKKNIDSLLWQKTDSIVLLKSEISEKENQSKTEKLKNEKQSRDEYERGKNEILIPILSNYKNRTFDELLKNSTKESVHIKLSLAENIPDVKLILSDIEKYFIAKEILDVKLDPSLTKRHQIELEQIKRESLLLNRLKEIISHYQTFNNGLKETIEKIIALDNSEAVSGMGKEIQRKKFDKILAEISSYIFNYDFNFSDYPYLSDILLELIKRKQPNADADITDLLKKL